MDPELTTSNEVPQLSNTPGATPTKDLKNKAALHNASQNTTWFFRLHDLPEELQRHIISFCLPESWSIRASRPIRLSQTQETQTPVSNPFFYGLCQIPPIPCTLYLIDKHTTAQVQACSTKRFTGELFLASVLGVRGITTYYQYGLGAEPSSGTLDGFRDLITTLHIGCYQFLHDFRGLDLSLIGVLPNLRMVIAHSENRLHEESLYGWGDAEHLIAMISDDALVKYVQQRGDRRDLSPGGMRQRESVLSRLWGAGLTTLHEMKANMGSGEMTVSFYCVFWVREGGDPVVLGKFSVARWVGSFELRRRVYERALGMATATAV